MFKYCCGCFFKKDTNLVTNLYENSNNDTAKWTLKNNVLLCKIVSVYDADTFWGCIYMPNTNNTIYKVKIRLAGCDAPELRTKNTREKLLSQKAKEFVESKILNKLVVLSDDGYDKYSRELCFVYMFPENFNYNQIDINNLNAYVNENQSLTSMLINKKFAVPYNGSGPKQDWDLFIDKYWPNPSF